jgi:soluble lytic murein transglycosylase-like protein
MIGNLMSRMADAEKLSVDQLKMALQNGTLPPYVGIPLLQDKVKQAQMMQTAQGAQQAQPEQPPIAQQVMAQAQGLDSMPSNLPTEEQAYAAGGIVAFAEGDLVDDEIETEDDRQEASLMSLMAAAQNKIKSGLGRATSGFTSALPKSVQSMLPTPTATPTTAPAAPTEGGIPGLINSAAKQENLPADLLRRISGAESSGNPNAANPRSSAKGIFQFTDSTWKGMGGKPGEQFNPEANVGLGAKYIRQNAEHLKKTLGRDPNYHEVYAAHMFGPGVSRMLNKANPKDPIERGLSTFQSPKQVKAIMKANPNLRGKSVGEVMNTLQLKTGQGIVSLAAGGQIAFATGGKPPKAGEVESGTENPYAMMGDIGASAGDSSNSPLGIQNWWKRHTYGTKENIEANTPKTEPTAEDRERQKQMEYQDYIEGPQERDRAERDRAAAEKAALQAGPQAGSQAGPQTPVTEALDPYLEKYMGMLQKRETESEKQKEIDGYMALMQAGLGMMGGSSPYALQNIGAGGTQGLTAYAAAQKQRAAEEAATLSGYGKLYTAKQASDLKRELTAAGREERALRFDEQQDFKTGQQLETIRKNITNEVLARRKLGMEALTDPATAPKIRAEVDAELLKHSTYPRLYKQYNKEPFTSTPVTLAPNTSEFYQSTYGTAPKPKQ